MVTLWHAICANCLQGGRRHFTGMERGFFGASAASEVSTFLERMSPPHTVPMGTSSFSLLWMDVLHSGGWAGGGLLPQEVDADTFQLQPGSNVTQAVGTSGLVGKGAS